LKRLPKVRPGVLPIAYGNPHRAKDDPENVVPLGGVREGRRNATLFRLLLRIVRHCDTMADLLDEAQWINDNFSLPLPEAEVEKHVRNVWKIEAEGRNWVGQEARVQIQASQIEALTTHRYAAEAAALFLVLRSKHWHRETFVVSPPAMARAGIIAGWGKQRYRHGLDALLEAGVLKLVQRGGRGLGDPHLFAFTRNGTGPMRN
jgi:hypothetical protein